MGLVLRHLLLLAVATALTWWLVFYDPRPQAAAAEIHIDELQVAVAMLEASASEAPAGVAVPETPPQEAATEPAEQPVEEALPATEPPAEQPEVDLAEDEPAATESEPLEDREPEAPEPAPPAPELGDPEGDPDEQSPPDAAPEPSEALAEPEQQAQEPAIDSESIELSAAALMRDDALLDAARREIDGEVRRGFSTVLVAAPEDQIDIARAFGEELVLVPRAALDPAAESPRWFRLDLSGTPRVESMSGDLQLERYRQYRDLFDYEYDSLPGPLRELRRSVLARSEIYLFAALIPAAEWAVVIGRRRDALNEAGRDADDVRRFVLRTERTEQGTFDVRVEEIVFADGTRFQPSRVRRQP